MRLVLNFIAFELLLDLMVVVAREVNPTVEVELLSVEVIQATPTAEEQALKIRKQLKSGIQSVANAHGKLSKLKEVDNVEVSANFKNGSKTAAHVPNLQCYERPNGTGYYRIFHGDAHIRDLGVKPWYFDNIIASCHFTGIYILYDGYDFQVEKVPPEINWGEYHLVNFNDPFAFRASSLRIVGAPEDWKISTLTLYRQGHWSDSQQMFRNDEGRLCKDNYGRAAVVTGCYPWTVYDEEGFQGNCVCIHPKESCEPGAYSDLRILDGGSGYWIDRISSVRTNCHCQTQIFPPNLTKQIVPWHMHKLPAHHSIC